MMQPATTEAATVSGLPRNKRASSGPKRPWLWLVAVEIETSPAEAHAVGGAPATQQRHRAGDVVVHR